ncbi:MAG: hypothetical protein IJ192_09420 [Clostridia bacterium]|nr:hypothetical protein [Clostridia bacterium]
MTDREFDRLIERSVKEFGDSYGTIENEEPNHIFSQRFENNMKVLISRQKKTKVNRIIKISAGAAAVLVIGVGSIAVSRMFSDGGLYGVDNISMNRSIAAPDVVGKNEASANISVEDEEDDIAQNDDAENGNAYSFKNDIKQNDSFDTEGEVPAANEQTPDTEEDASQPSVSENQTGESANKTTSAYAYRVTAQSHGMTLKLTDEQMNTLTEMAKNLVNDSRLTVDLAMSYEEMDSFKNDGYYITVSMQDGSPIEINDASGATLMFNTITLMLKDNQGYALAEDENGSVVFEISGADVIYGILDNLLNE